MIRHLPMDHRTITMVSPLGSGIAYGRFIFDIAYQFRFGNNVGELNPCRV